MTRDRLFLTIFCLLAVATALPIWLVEYLPLLDLPNHLSAITVWHYHDDPNWHFAENYQLNLVPLPSWAHYYTVHLLTYLTRSVELANRIFLTAYAFAVPTGAWLFTRRFNRSHWLALFAFPLVWNFNFADGFIAYCAGFAWVPLVLVVVDRYCARPTWPGALAVLVLGSLTYFFHLLAYALFLVCGGLLVLVHERPFSPRAFAIRALPVLSCSAVGLWAFRHANRMEFHKLSGAGRELIRDPLATTLASTPERLLNFLPGAVDEWLVVVFILCWLGLAVTAARVPRRADDPAPRLHDWGVELCMLGALALYVAAPRSMRHPFYWHMINGRFVVALAFFAPLTLRGRIDGWRRLWLLPVAIFTVVYVASLSRAFVLFNRHAYGLDALVAEIPRDKSVLTLILRPMDDPTVNVSAFNQFPSYVQIHHGGYNFYNFSDGFPLKYLKRMPAPPWSHAEDFKWEHHARGWDYFLTFREGWQYRPMDEPVAQGKVRLVATQGAWKLYEKLGHDPPDPLTEHEP